MAFLALPVLRALLPDWGSALAPAAQLATPLLTLALFSLGAGLRTEGLLRRSAPATKLGVALFLSSSVAALLLVQL